jgi:hypothetical protein
MANEITRQYDAEGDIAAVVVGGGTVLIQACALFPGLLPCLLLLLPFVLPLVVLGALAGVLVGLPLGAWRLAAWATRPLRRRAGHILPPGPVKEATSQSG